MYANAYSSHNMYDHQPHSNTTKVVLGSASDNIKFIFACRIIEYFYKSLPYCYKFLEISCLILFIEEYCRNLDLFYKTKTFYYKSFKAVEIFLGNSNKYVKF